MSFALQTGSSPDATVSFDQCGRGSEAFFQTVVHLLTQLFTRLEVGHKLGRQLNRFPGFRVATGAGFPVMQGKTTKPPDFNSLRSEEHTSELQSRPHLVCRLLLEK